MTQQATRVTTNCFIAISLQIVFAHSTIHIEATEAI